MVQLADDVPCLVTTSVIRKQYSHVLALHAAYERGQFLGAVLQHFLFVVAGDYQIYHLLSFVFLNTYLTSRKLMGTATQKTGMGAHRSGTPRCSMIASSMMCTT